MLPEQKLDALLTRHKMVEGELASGLAPEAYVKLSREFAELGPVIETIKAYRAVTSEIADLTSLLDDAATDAEMRTIAATEIPRHLAGPTPRPRPLRCSRRRRRSTLPSTRGTSRSTRCARAVPAASTSTRPSRPSA